MIVIHSSGGTSTTTTSTTTTSTTTTNDTTNNNTQLRKWYARMVDTDKGQSLQGGGEDLFHGHLQRLDDSLRCGICHETLDVPLVLTTCGHSCMLHAFSTLSLSFSFSLLNS
jgi:hypothetical protein